MLKIIISPSKTQKINFNTNYTAEEPEFINETIKINDYMKKFSFSELKSIYKASDAIVNEAHKNIHHFDNSSQGQAIFSYTGAVFKEIKANELKENDLEFLNDTLLILSAHYGILKPFSLIKSYRLDYNMKIPGINLKDLWKEKINDYLKNETIINLASNEFSSLIDIPMLNVEFKELRKGSYKVIGTYAKQARGQMVNNIIKNKITDTEKLKKLTINGYIFNHELSNKNNFIYTK